MFEKDTQNGAANNIDECKNNAIEMIIDMVRNIINLCKKTRVFYTRKVFK